MENNYTRIYDINTKQSRFQSLKKMFGGPAGIFLLAMFILLVLQGITSFIGSLSIDDIIIKGLITIPVILLSLTLHEYSHAKMAVFLGDNTPKVMGRLSLNPLKHLDIWGTLLLIFAGFGWAKPVEVNPNNCRNPERAMVSIALAGPIANMILAISGVIFLKLLMIYGMHLGAYLCKILISLGQHLIQINLILMFFNLIPITPLDGSRVLKYFISPKYKFKYQQIEAMGPTILIFLMLLGGLDKILIPIVQSTYSFLISFII